MKAVGVKVLKSRLSEYLRLVRAGETVLVTDRDEVIAELRPANRQQVTPPSLEDLLHAQADLGAVTLRAEDSAGRWPTLEPLDTPLAPLGIRSEDLLNELREDWEPE